MQEKKTPANSALYNRVKAEAKRKFRVWPSAYASAWLVKKYKRRGGTYKGSKTRSPVSSPRSGLTRWFDEKWINVCKLPKKVPCGRPKANIKAWKKKYPYCRPSRSITNKSPRTASQLSKAEIKRRCARKKRSPMKRILPLRRTPTRRRTSSRKAKASPRRRRKSPKKKH
jgi:hypothetical protein